MHQLRALFLASLACSLFVSGCAASLENLVARAQFDLDCPEKDLRVVPLDSKTRGVTGCGKRATYLEVCDLTGWGPMNCRWVLNSPGSPVPAAGGQVMPPPFAPPPMPPPPVH